MYLSKNEKYKAHLYKINLAIGVFSFFLLLLIEKNLLDAVIQTVLLLLFLFLSLFIFKKIVSDEIFFRYLFLILFLSIIFLELPNIIVFYSSLLVFYLKKRK